MLRYGRKREEVKEDQPPTIAFIRSLLNDTCTLHQPLKAIRNHQFFAHSSIDCQLSLSLSFSLIHAHTLSVSISRLDIVEGSINTKLRLIHVHHRWHDFSNWLFRVSICATCGSVESVENERHSWFFFRLIFFLLWFFQKKILEIQNKKQFIYKLFLWSLKLYDEGKTKHFESRLCTYLHVRI